jgi:hypothetical protein
MYLEKSYKFGIQPIQSVPRVVDLFLPHYFYHPIPILTIVF